MKKMKKLCAVGLAALCLAGSMSCFTMAEASENVQEQAQDQMLYSSRMWESNGHIYTVYNVDAEGYTSLSGNYMDAIAVYEGKVYWRKNNGEENEPAEIIRMEPDVPDRRFWQKMRILPRFCALMRDLSTILLQMKRESKKAAGSIWTQGKIRRLRHTDSEREMKTSGFPHLWKTGYGIARSPDIKISGQCQG